MGRGWGSTQWDFDFDQDIPTPLYLPSVPSSTTFKLAPPEKPRIHRILTDRVFTTFILVGTGKEKRDGEYSKYLNHKEGTCF